MCYPGRAEMGRLTQIQFVAVLLLFAVQNGTTQSGSKFNDLLKASIAVLYVAIATM